MHLLLVRHAEAEKNLTKAFSSADGSEELTPRGRAQAEELATGLKRLSEALAASPLLVHCTHSVRSMATAEILGRELGVQVRSYDALRSFGLTALHGQSEAEAESRYQVYMHETRLYRAGLFDIYRSTVPPGSEPSEAFEGRVRRQVEEILAVEDEPLKIVVAHRSALTAILIDFARRYHHYPEDFYGFVPLELGSVSWLVRDRRGRWRIADVNVAPADLTSRCAAVSALGEEG